MTKKMKVAFIGAGSMAREHIKAFRDLPGVELAGIFSRTRSKAEALAKEFGIATVCNDIADLFEKTHADLCVVTVFEVSMEPVALKAMNYPWALFLEKPPGYSVDSTERLHQKAVQNKRKVYVALNRRFHSSTQQTLSKLESSTGSRYVRVMDQQDLGVAKQIGHPDVVVEHWMYANSIHLVDYLNVLCRGKVTKVTPLVAWNPKNPGLVLAKVDYSSGDVGLYEGIWNGPGPWSVVVSTPEIRYEIRPLEQLTVQLRGERKLTPIEVDPVDTQFKAGFRLQADQVLKAVRGEPNSSPTLEAGLDSMKLVQQIFAGKSS